MCRGLLRARPNRVVALPLSAAYPDSGAAVGVGGYGASGGKMDGSLLVMAQALIWGVALIQAMVLIALLLAVVLRVLHQPRQ
jgi:hypothetical protein